MKRKSIIAAVVLLIVAILVGGVARSASAEPGKPQPTICNTTQQITLTNYPEVVARADYLEHEIVVVRTEREQFKNLSEIQAVQIEALTQKVTYKNATIKALRAKVRKLSRR